MGRGPVGEWPRGGRANTNHLHFLLPSEKQMTSMEKELQTL